MLYTFVWYVIIVSILIFVLIWMLYSLNICDISAATMDRTTIDLEQGWAYMQNGITKLKRILEGSSEAFSSEEYMMLYTYPFQLLIVTIAEIYNCCCLFIVLSIND
jgi:hypothetical protein